MDHQKISAERDTTDKLVMKCLNRTRAEHRLRRRQIDQVVRVDYQRTEAKFGATRTKCDRIGIRNARSPLCPHAGAGREDLERVATQLPSRLEGVQITAGDRCMYADAEAAVHPGRC